MAGLGWAGLAAVVVCEAWLMLSNGLGPPPAQHLQCCSAAVTRGHAANTGPLFSQHASSLPSAGEARQDLMLEFDQFRGLELFCMQFRD